MIKTAVKRVNHGSDLPEVEVETTNLVIKVKKGKIKNLIFIYNIVES